MNKPIALFVIVSSLISIASANVCHAGHARTSDTLDIILRDTVYEFVFDSTKHNLGEIEPNDKHNRLIKHFKYIGEKPISITRAWTGDPHYICQYPRETLIPNQMYSFTVCFHHEGRQGYMSKDMGFDLSDGRRIFFKFKGHYIDATLNKQP